MVSLLLPSCSSTVYTLIQELGSLSFWYATFITRRTATPHVPSRRPTPWTGLSLADPSRLMQFLFTIQGTSTTTNPTAKSLILIASPHPFMQKSSTMAASLFLSIAMTTPPSVNRTHLGHESWTSTLLWDRISRAQLWTSHLTQFPPPNTSLCLTMAQHAPSRRRTCHPSSQNRRSPYQTQPTSFRLSFSWVPRSPTNATASTTKAYLANPPMAPSISVTNLTSTRRPRTGVPPSLT